MADKVYKTRIALKIDKETNWNEKDPKLFPGEFGLAYGGADYVDGKFKYTQFKIKVGAVDKYGRNIPWSELQEISLGTISPEQMEEIMEQVKQELSKNYVLQATFEEFKKKVSSEIVTGWDVENESLYLVKGFTEDMQFS